MSKAVFVMDMPESCYDCRMRFNVFGSNVCVLADRSTNIADAIIENKTKACYCPLKELPSTLSLRDAHGKGFDDKEFSYRMGWDDCLDAIGR